MSGTEYTQGVCDDGAAILRDGAPIAIEEILSDLRRFEICRQALKDICETLEYLDRKAKQNGGRLNSHAAQLVNDPEVLRSIAWAALAEVDL